MSNGYGASKFASAILTAVDQRVGTTTWLELGVIQPDLSLLADKFPVPIPQGDYLVTRWMSGYTMNGEVVSPKLQPGDRVMIAWVNGTDPVIIDVVVSGSA